MHARNLLALLALTVSALPAAPSWQSCHLPGEREALRCTTIAVPRNYADTTQGQLDLHITIAPAVRARAEADPLFVLAGGPGQAGSDIVFLLEKAFAKVRTTRDVIFIDQRGTGRSEPLTCELSADPLLQSQREQEAAMLNCMRGFGDRLVSYTTDAAADDLERVRETLGAARINLWGGSYGSRLAQVYAQRHPDRVRSLILDGVVDADVIIGAENASFEAAFDTMLQRCAADPGCARAFPSPRQDLQEALAELDSAKPMTVSHPRNGQPVAVAITRMRLLRTIQYLLYSPSGVAQLPYLLARARAGDWRPLLAVQVTGADLATAAPAPGLLMAIMCREDWPRLTAERRADVAGSNTFGSLNLDANDAICDALGLPAAPLPPLQPLATRSLLLSGALDPVTPPSMAERARRSLPNSLHAIAANAGHIISGSGCAPSLLRRFLDAPTQSLDTACLDEITSPAFQTSAAGAGP